MDSLLTWNSLGTDPAGRPPGDGSDSIDGC
jgi:hypothetical protein